MNNILDKNHLSLQFASDVISLCEPLFRNSIVSFLNYCRFLPNGHVYCLTNHPEWLKYHFSQEYRLIEPINEDYLQMKKFHCLLEPSDISFDIADRFNMHVPIDFIECTEEYVDLFCFAFPTSKKENECINYYMNSLDIFEKFKLYFMEKAGKMISQLEEKKILLPSHMRGISSTIVENTETNIASQRNNIIKQLSTTKKTFVINRKKIALTKREIECLQFIGRGRSAKEISKNLDISHRTVESHICNIKYKLDCHTKSNLIDFIQTYKTFFT